MQKARRIYQTFLEKVKLDFLFSGTISFFVQESTIESRNCFVQERHATIKLLSYSVTTTGKREREKKSETVIAGRR